MLENFWSTLSRSARLGLVAGVAGVAVATALVTAWIWRTDYQVLFSDLKPQDTATMVAELDRLKVAYKIAADGNTILVGGDLVHATRLKLMGKDIPLHGAAGFELFNNAEFGMTEFAQKINYQRALQGEITRTILSLAEVRDVRVHLALPEEGLFKRATSKAKAAITLSLKAGQSLRPEQITGIQRLVSAAVPGIAAPDVTLVDQHGVALTRAITSEGEQDAAAGRLDLKRETERLLARKATEVLERAFGPGQAMASVDVTLNMDQVRVTTEDVLGAPGPAGQSQAGVMVREREVARDVGAPLNGHTGAGGRASNSQREVDYQVGRRVEQVVSQPGAVRRLNVVALIRQRIDDAQTEQLRVLVAAAVGAVPERGDAVVVQSLKPAEAQNVDDLPIATLAGAAAPVLPSPLVGNFVLVASLVAVVLALALAGMGWRVSRRRQLARADMTEEQRQILLEKLRSWLDGSESPQPAAGRPALEPAASGVRP